jgi:hypothetical protein
MSMRASFWRKVLLVLAVAWFSSVTMLIPWPPTTLHKLQELGIATTDGAGVASPQSRNESGNLAGPTSVSSRGLWIRWGIAVVFVAGGLIAALVGSRGHRLAIRLSIAFSLIYLGYWLSEYVLAIGTVGSVLQSVANQIASENLGSSIVVVQHQILLPLVHLACVGYFAVKGVPGSRRD